jgi:DNA-binding CsgD family transcriptional regulator
VPAERPELTHYEERVLARILLGESNKEIAKRLGCSVKNVEYHVTQILRRTGVSSRLKLVATMSSTTR